MAVQPRLDPASVGTIQPTPGTSPVDVQAEVTLAGAQSKGIAEGQQIAGQVQQLSTNLMREEALKSAQQNAAKSVTIDPVTGDPVYDDSTRGLGGLVYNQAFNEAAFANYRSHALASLNRKAEIALAENPNNPEAVARVLQPYVDSTLKAMPEPFRTQLAPHFSGVVNAARSSSLVGKARSDIAGISNSLKGSYQSIVVDMGKAIAETPGTSFDLPAGPQRIAFEQRLADHAREQRGTGASEADIARTQKEAWAHARAHAFGIGWGRMIGQAATASPEQGALATAQALEALQTFSQMAENTPYYDQLAGIAMGHIQRAQGIAGAREAAVTHNTSELAADFRRRSAEISRAYRAGEISEGTAKAQDLALESERGLAMAGRRPSHALAIMTAGSETITAAIGDTGLQQQQWQRTRDAQVLSSHQAVAAGIIETHTNSTDGQVRRDAIIQAQEVYDLDFVKNQASRDPAYQQIRSAMGGLIAKSVANASAFERTEAMEKLRSGRVPKEHIPGIIQSWVDNGTIGEHGIGYKEAVALAAEGSRNADARASIEARAENAQATIARGGVPSADQADALAQWNKMKAGGGITSGGTAGSTTSVSAAGETTTRPAQLDEEGVRQALSHSAINVSLPEAFRKELTAVAERLQVDPGTQKAFVNLVRGWEQQRINAMTTTLSNPRELHTTVAALSKQHFGAKVLEAARIYEKGHGEATPELISIQMEKLGVKPERQMDRNNAEWSNVAQAVISGGIVGQSIDARDKDPNSFSQRAGRVWLSELGLNSNAYLHKFPAFSKMKQRIIFGNGLPEEANESNMHISGLVLKNLTDWQVTKYLPSERDSDLKQGFNPIEQGSTIWMNENKTNLSWVKSTDPTTGAARFTLSYKGFEDELKKANPALKDYSHDQVNMMLAARMKAHFLDKYMDAVPGSITAIGEESALGGGRMIYRVVGKSISGGGTIDFTWIDPADKQWNAEGEIVSNTVARVMKDNAAKSIWTEYVTQKFFREDAMKEVRDQVLADFSDKKDVGEAWSRIWHSVRNAVGAFKGVSPESYERHMAPEIGRAIGWAGVLSYITSPGEPIAVPRRPFDPMAPSAALPAQPGQHSNVDLLVRPAADVDAGDPSQYRMLRNREDQEKIERVLASRGGVTPTLPGGYTPPPINLRPQDPTPAGPVEPPAAQAARLAATVAFNPEGPGYDIEAARAAGLRPQEEPGPNQGHMGSVARASEADRRKYGLPDESYIMLKGRSHESWRLGLQGETERGFKVVKLGNRYYSVPRDWKKP